MSLKNPSRCVASRNIYLPTMNLSKNRVDTANVLPFGLDFPRFIIYWKNNNSLQIGIFSIPELVILNFATGPNK